MLRYSIFRHKRESDAKKRAVELQNFRGSTVQQPPLPRPISPGVLVTRTSIPARSSSHYYQNRRRIQGHGSELTLFRQFWKSPFCTAVCRRTRYLSKNYEKKRTNPVKPLHYYPFFAYYQLYQFACKCLK